MKESRIVLCLFFLLPACAEGLSKEEFCERLPDAVCDKLLDAACGDDHASRYETRTQCQKEERQVCQELTEDSSLLFSESKAYSCVTQVEDADCQKAWRSDFHACNEVFGQMDPPLLDNDEQ